jgi:hypothetical protein
MLLRRGGRRGFLRRSVFVGALAGMLLVAPGASASAPVITPVIFGTVGLNGWYTSNLTINWQFDGPVETSSGCEADTIYTDTPGKTYICSATRDGFTTKVEKTFKVDKTVPAVTTVLERGADANGWYNRPLTVAFTGADGTSGIASCTSGRYAGPDSTSALIAGSCTDKAGNHAPASFAFRYDATPPSIFGTTATHGNRSAQISWRKSSDTRIVEVFRTPGRNGQGESGIYRGSATGVKDTGLVVGRKYEYRVIGVDEAANRAEQKLSLVATGALLSPTPGLRITSKSPPTLVWAPARKATYYNLQLIRGRKVLSAWPTRPSFRLRRTWLYNGRRYRLKPGVYRWYVWPGYGRISAARYADRPLGSSTFVVTK